MEEETGDELMEGVKNLKIGGEKKKKKKASLRKRHWMPSSRS